MSPREHSREPKPNVHDNKDPRSEQYRPSTGTDQHIDEQAEEEARDDARPLTEAEQAIERIRTRHDDGTE